MIETRETKYVGYKHIILKNKFIQAAIHMILFLCLDLCFEENHLLLQCIMNDCFPFFLLLLLLSSIQNSWYYCTVKKIQLMGNGNG